MQVEVADNNRTRLLIEEYFAGFAHGQINTLEFVILNDLGSINAKAYRAFIFVIEFVFGQRGGWKNRSVSRKQKNSVHEKTPGNICQHEQEL